MIQHYIRIARPDHWFKNLFMLPGVILALEFSNSELSIAHISLAIFSTISICLAASANYVINEWLDAEFDKHHPKKKFRASVQQDLAPLWVYTEYATCAIISLVCAWQISEMYTLTTIVFMIAGACYNIKPIRTKDKIYLDVISESLNNPLRLMLGWLIVSNTFPPTSIMLSYWMGGAFLMATKRFAEYRFINNPEIAGLYRQSFKHYNEQNLLISIVFYALMSSFFLGAFLIKHKVELILSFPLFSILFVWYLKIGFKHDSPVQNPEKLYREPWFMTYVCVLTIVIFTLIQSDIPALHFLLK